MIPVYFLPYSTADVFVTNWLHVQCVSECLTLTCEITGTGCRVAD